MEDDEREFTFIVFHGFKSGQEGNAIMDYCIDNRSQTLMKALDKKR